MVSTVAKDVVGGVGGAILSFCLLPQLWKMWRTRSAADLSMPFIVLYTVGGNLAVPHLIALGYSMSLTEKRFASVTPPRHQSMVALVTCLHLPFYKIMTIPHLTSPVSA